MAVLQILKNHIVPGVKLSTAQLRTQSSPLPNLLGQSLQVHIHYCPSNSWGLGLCAKI